MKKLTALPVALGIGLFISIFLTLVAPLNHTHKVIAAPNAHLDLSLDLITAGLDKPTAIAHTPLPNDGRLFIAQQGGQIRIIDENGTLLPRSFLNISAKVHLFGENGLLGLAFDPDYAQNGRYHHHPPP